MKALPARKRWTDRVVFYCRTIQGNTTPKERSDPGFDDHENDFRDHEYELESRAGNLHDYEYEQLIS